MDPISRQPVDPPRAVGEVVVDHRQVRRKQRVDPLYARGVIVAFHCVIVNTRISVKENVRIIVERSRGPDCVVVIYSKIVGERGVCKVGIGVLKIDLGRR